MILYLTLLEKMKRYSADFETATWKEDETWVWAWCLCEIGNEENIEIGNNIESFMKFCEKNSNNIYYFHNLKFDGEFIIYWLLKNGYEHIHTQQEKKDKSFFTTISDMGMFYQIIVYYKVWNKKVKKVTFIDSLKIIPLSVESIPKAFNLREEKLEIDYKEEREKGHILTDEEREYIRHDVVIVAKGLKNLFDEKLTHMTQGSNALNNYKEILTRRKFEHYFPELDYDVDKDIRQSYKGGFTYLNPIYKEKEVNEGVVLDVNSLYPSVMRYSELPFGNPVFFSGKYEYDRIYPLYIQMLHCRFKIKKNKIPTIQIKNNKYFIENEYLTDSGPEEVTLVLTNIDLKLFFEHYDVYDLEYESGWKFKSMTGLFNEYIDKWIARKNEATITGNKGLRTICKLMLNSLYGKFATSMDVRSKEPYLEDDIVHYNITEKETKKGVYLPMGCFITSYAREKTIRTSQKIKEYSIKKYKKDMYIYSDTDSIHTLLNIEELKQFCEIDDVELGKWKHEATFSRAKFVRQKCYIEEIDGKMKITCAGMPKNCYKYVKWEDFKTGFTCGGKLTFKHVKGGVILVDTDFTIKE